MTLSLEKIVKEMGKGWVDEVRREARRRFSYHGRNKIEHEARYIRMAYNSAKAA